MRRDTQIIVHAIRDIAAGLGMSITAEGVETEEQASYLRQTGCHELQGYLFSKPRPAEELSFRGITELEEKKQTAIA
jgi:EAL domain-containing protein (putative c-di-GMP-specific phosphodiesterase class I)